MSDRFCGFDIDRVGSLKKALDAVPGSAGQLSRDIAAAVEEADRIALAAAGLSNRAFYDEAVSYDTDPDRTGLRTVASAGPDTAAEIGRRLAHLVACEKLAHDGFTVDAADAFADAPPPDEDKIKAALARFHQLAGSSDMLDTDKLTGLANQVIGLDKTETEAFVGALSDHDLTAWNVMLGVPQFMSWGLDSNTRVALANSLLSKLCSDQVLRVGHLLTALEPSLAQMDKDASWSWVDGSLYGPDGAQIQDIHQGEDGDCWFMASLAAELRQNPNFVRDHLHDNGNGTYTVTFYQDGKPVPITVDGQLPTKNGTSMTFSHGDPGWGTDGPTWMAIYEKAFAQLNGGYHAIEGGYGSTGMTALTGQNSVKLPPVLPLSAMQAALASGHPITAGTDSHRSGFLWLHSDEYFDDGKLVTLHEYTVVAVDPQADTITLRNPWGSQAAAPEYVTLTGGEFRSHFTEVSIGNE